MAQKFKIETLGCRTNQYESQALRDQLEKLGMEEAKDGESPDLCFINTCSVTEKADSESAREVKKLAARFPRAKIIALGCSVRDNRFKEPVLSIPNEKKATVVSSLFPLEESPPFEISHFKGHTRAFVKVQDGCNAFCSYCIVPYVRGRSSSRPLLQVKKEVERLLENGFKEIVLTGVNLGDHEDLPTLIREIENLPNLQRLRLSSLDPHHVDTVLFETLVGGNKICHNLHLVLQSGSDRILKRMRRRYTRDDYLALVKRLRKEDPAFSFTTDLIVGFPSESEEDFEESLRLIEEVSFVKVHIFPFSTRKGTAATSMPDQLPLDLIRERLKRAKILADKVAYKSREPYLGKTVEILTEKAPTSFGYTSHFIPVFLPHFSLKENQLLSVKILRNTKKGLEGCLQK